VIKKRMLQIPLRVATAFQAEGLVGLRKRILAGWHEKLRRAGELIGESGRNEILDMIEAMARDDPSLTVVDLQMLADLMLVDRANIARQGGQAL